MTTPFATVRRTLRIRPPEPRRAVPTKTPPQTNPLLISGLTESLLMKHASPRVVQGGNTYYERGAVISVVLRGDELQAFVEGSDVEVDVRQAAHN